MPARSAFNVGSRKVAIVGAGYVGSTIAYALALRDIAREVALVDLDEHRVAGEALDIRHGIPSMGTCDIHVGDYADCGDCDLVIICAGRGRRPGESRTDLLGDNIEAMRSVADSVMARYTRGAVLVVSNPVDVMTYKLDGWMGLPNGMVFGTGNMLDSSRFVRTVADYVGIGTGVVSGYVVGEHGDGQVPVWSSLTVGGIGIEEYCESSGIAWNAEVRESIAERTRHMGGEIIAAKGRTHYGIATCVCHLADAILNQRPTIASVCSVLQGEHGCRDVALSVPSVVGVTGVQHRIRERWAPEEYRGFFDAAERFRRTIEELP